MGCGSFLNPFSSSNPITGKINEKLGIDKAADKLTGKLLPQEQEDFFKNPGKTLKERGRDFDRKRRATTQTARLLLDGEGGSDAWTKLGKQVLDEEASSRRLLSAGDPLTDEMTRGQISARNRIDKYAQPLLNPQDPAPEPPAPPTGSGAVNAKSMGNTAYSSSALYEEGMLPGSINTANYKR